VVGTGILFKGVYIGSYIKDTLVYSCSGNGIRIDGGTGGTVLVSDLYLENIWITGCNDHLLLITGSVESVTGRHIACENPAAGKACMMCMLNGGSSINGEHNFSGFFMEGTNASDGVVLTECGNVQMDTVVYDSSGFNSVIKITGS